MIFRPKRGGLLFCIPLGLGEFLVCISTLSAARRGRLRKSESTEGNRGGGGGSDGGESGSHVRSIKVGREDGVCEPDAEEEEDEEDGALFAEMIGIL
jgi:hypothetical protein